MDQNNQAILEAFAKAVINDPAFKTVPQKNAREAAVAEVLGLTSIESPELAAYNTFKKMAEGGLNQSDVNPDARVTSQDIKNVLTYGNTAEAPEMVKKLVQNKTPLLKNIAAELEQLERGGQNTWLNRVQEAPAAEKKRGLG